MEKLKAEGLDILVFKELKQINEVVTEEKEDGDIYVKIDDCEKAKVLDILFKKFFNNVRASINKDGDLSYVLFYVHGLNVLSNKSFKMFKMDSVKKICAVLIFAQNEISTIEERIIPEKSVTTNGYTKSQISAMSDYSEILDTLMRNPLDVTSSQLKTFSEVKNFENK